MYFAGDETATSDAQIHIKVQVQVMAIFLMKLSANSQREEQILTQALGYL